MKKAVLFDLDGVLVDTEPVYARCAAEALQKFGAPATEQELYPLAGLEAAVKFRQMLERYHLDADLLDLETCYRGLQMEALADFSRYPKPGVKEALSAIKARGYTTAVCSNSVTARVKKVLADLTLTPYIDCICAGDLVQRRKPDPQVYLLALTTLSLSPEECLAVEDSSYGIQAAKSACLDLAAIYDPRFPFDQSTADYHIHSLAELPALLEEL